MALTKPRDTPTVSSDAIRGPVNAPRPANGGRPAEHDAVISQPSLAGAHGGPGDADRAAAAIDLAAEYGGSRLLISDIRTTFILLNAARHRVIERMFGVSKDQENLLTLVALLILADAAHDQVRRLAGVGPPSSGDGLLAAGTLQELLCTVAGPSSRETPMLGTLLMIAVVAGSAGPTVFKSLHKARAASHRTALAFHHRYGYLIDPGHWREHRAGRGG